MSSQLVSRPAAGAVAAIETRPLISAILVTHNKESFLRECLCGLMEQSVAHRMEVIVVDQGSEQSEWSIVADLQRRHQNLLGIRTAASLGYCAALNLGLRIASGRYVTIIEPSDRMRQNAFQTLYTALEADPRAMLAYGDTCFTAIPHESFANHTSCGRMIWPDYTSQQLSQLPVVAPHLMWRRELHDSIGWFNESSDAQGMRDFLLRVVERFKVSHVEEFIGLKLVPPGSNATAPHLQGRELPTAPAVEQIGAAAPAPVPTPVQVAAPAPAPAAEAMPAPADPETAYGTIQTLIDGAADREALEALRRHLELYPDHARAHNDLAAISFQSGDKDTALNHYRRALELQPDETTYAKNLADLLFVAEGRSDEAIAIYLKLLEAFPRDVETLTNLGIICDAVQHPEEAETFYQRALEIEPWNQLVRDLITDLRERAAEAAAAGTAEPRQEPVQEEEPESEEEHYEKSQALVAQGDLEGAARELEALLAYSPDFPPAHNDLAVLHYQKGDKKEALYHYERAAELAPGNSTFRKNLADFYFVEGHDVDAAVTIYLELLKKEPRNIETLMNLGRICTLLDRPEEAESFYAKVTQLEPWNRDARECLSTLRAAANG